MTLQLNCLAACLDALQLCPDQRKNANDGTVFATPKRDVTSYDCALFEFGHIESSSL